MIERHERETTCRCSTAVTARHHFAADMVALQYQVWPNGPDMPISAPP
jgi:hypothetical protein